MINEIKKIERSAKTEIPEAKTAEDLQELKIQFLGRERGALTLILRGLKQLPEKERVRVGKDANKLRGLLESLFEKRGRELEALTIESVLKTERIDVTRPGVRQKRGHLHPHTTVLDEIERIFGSMGFEVAEGPEVETEHYNFDALNIPADHPARDMWDTFWLRQNESKRQNSPPGANPPQAEKVKSNERLLLRTHTSPVQIRYMEKHNPPFRIIAPGRAYRYEATDASHEFQFYQVEGLMVDKTVSIANFKAVIESFFSQLFKTKVRTRLRPSYFPFVEPGFEVDIACVICNQKGCSPCKKTGWLEMMGAGMVHPNVFKAAGYNPKQWQGFAFGMGLDRIVMMKYKIPDIRLFHSGDLRFLKQF
ncbi:MAG: phenylalanine--tRNA ligase subunit alpha [Candidatus Sungbacteria bacterium]|nr:phenylalanine--tRNA ligase subunit alpha [Candidatus Sungbacteria bacterium]